MQDSFNENDGLLNAMGHMAAISQRNKQIAQQKEHAEAIRKQTAELEKANRIEADRAQIERQRLAIEQQRLEADELEREMRKQQAEQVRQLRNLMVDSMDTLESVKKSLVVQSVDNASKETALRKTAALQAQLKILDSQSDILTDMSDMKELRSFRSSLSEFISEQSASGNLPDNPLGIIKERLKSLKSFFFHSDADLDHLLNWKSDWLNQFSKVSLAELQQAQTELSEIKTQLPSIQERLRGMLNPLDWSTISSSPDLHEELRICAEIMPCEEIESSDVSMGRIILQGSEKSYRPYLPESEHCTDIYEFVHSKGEAFSEVLEHLDDVTNRVDDLVLLHTKHQELLAEAEAHLANDNFRSAERVVKTYDKQRFPDIDYQKIDSLLQRQLAEWRKFADLEAQVNTSNYQEFHGKLRKAKENHVKAGSELATEISDLTQKIELAIDAHHQARKKSLRTKSIVIFLIVVAIGSLTAYIIKEKIKAQWVKAKLPAEINAGLVGYPLGVPLVGKTVMPFAFCPAGSFTMGSPSAEDGRSIYENQVSVTLSKAFWMAKTEVTQAQWRAVMGTDPSNFKGDELPVECVSWEDAQEFIKKVNDSGVLPESWKIALPTQAQWEYACRAGETGPYSGGTIEQVAWYDGNSGNKTHAVGTKKSNAWGLHDMHGNVWEWCADWYDDSLSGGTDPYGRSSGVNRVYRGGSGNVYAANCRSASQNGNFPGDRNCYLGFRPALVPSE
jgi:hypothetical protein